MTDDDDLAQRARFIGYQRGGVKQPGIGRVHTEAGYAFRMAQCTAATCLAQLEIIHEQVQQRDKMVRLLSRRINEIPGVRALDIPGYVDVYSAWMFSFCLEPGAFVCSTEDFARQLAAAGIPEAGIGKYYLMPIGAAFLNDRAQAKTYPYCQPPASRSYQYDQDTCPNAAKFVEHWVRWLSFSEKYTEEHCELAAEIVADVAQQNRR